MKKEEFIFNKEYIIIIFLIFIMLIIIGNKNENVEIKYKEIINEKVFNDERIEKLEKNINKKQKELELAQLELIKLKNNSKKITERKLSKIKINDFQTVINIENKNGKSLSEKDRKRINIFEKKIEINKDKIIEENKDVLALNKSNLANKTLNLSKIKNYKLFWPVESEIVTSEFGDRYHPILKQNKFHRGVDIDGKRGGIVKASFDGIVTFAGEKGDYGYLVEVERDDGLKVRYAHLDKIEVVLNQLVSEGEKIGEIGSTGLATAPHLHFEIIIDSIPVNPMRFKYYK